MVDVSELRRMATNAVGDQRMVLQNMIIEINNMQNEFMRLKKENLGLKEQLDQKADNN
jgi:hypothetical protein